MSAGAKTRRIGPARRVEGRLRVPGDKSISHRAVLIAAMGEGRLEVRNLSPAEDVARSIEAVRALGGAVRSSNSQVEGESPNLGASSVELDGKGWKHFASPEGEIDVGNSGTTIRILAGMLSGSSATASITGDASLRRRPMDRVVDPLRRMGARITGPEGGSRAPLRIEGRMLHGADHELRVASAQVKTALLLAGLEAQGLTSVTEPSPSRDHTERMLRYCGVPVIESSNRLIVESTKISNPSSIDVPGDISSAAFHLAAAAILPGSHLLISDVGLNPTRVGFLEVLGRFGALSTISGVEELSGEPRGTVELRAADRRPLEVGGDLVPRCIDELPLVAVLGALAEGETVVTGAAELRVKESDRIATLVGGLAAMGADIEPLPDGFVVRGGPPLRGARVDPGGDHRIAMALAVAALAAEGETSIEGWGCVGVSYPGFERDLDRLAIR